MAEAVQHGVYVCEICGNVAELLRAGQGELVCCGEPMKRMDEQTADSSTEKHVPVIEKTDSGYSVVVGSTLHPMVEKHFIEWIELIVDGKSCKKFLKPGDEPKAEFCTCTDDAAASVSAREFCNVHGLWRAEK